MKMRLNCLIVEPLSRFSHWMIRRFIPAPFFFTFVFVVAARAQLPPSSVVAARSISGQFAVLPAQQISPFGARPVVLTNADLVRLEPALLAISAERIKKSLWQELQIDDGGQWRGEIFLALHSARSLDENVTIISSRFNGRWTYRVELPDIISRTRLTRAITTVVLQEFANRNAGNRSAEIPGWLVEGLSQQLLAANSAGFILSPPAASQNGIAEKRIVATQRGWDLLMEAHRILQNQEALTFEQLSWPSDAQLAGRDGGVYRASAQLFVDELLNLKDGARNLQQMLQTLPDFLNWQIAFRDAFKAEFPTTLDLEKWWAVETVNFAALDIGPMWTEEASRDKLDEILTVPVEYRVASNNFPAHAEISLQAVIRNFDLARKVSVLQVKLRDLRLAELRMSPQFAGLTAQYVQTISEYLGQRPAPRKVVFGKNFSVAPIKPDMKKTLKRLDSLDASRRALETALAQPGPSLQMPVLTGRDSKL